MKTFLDVLNEAKIDAEYSRNWSMIDRQIFDTIALADPKVLVDADGIRSLGFGSKQLLLPKYKDGETSFIDNLDEVTKALQKFYADIKKYPPFTSFKSVAEFISFMENPDSVNIAEPEKELDPITKIYNQYYSDIKRDDFDKIIAMDSKTTQEGIGEIAKNLLLVNYRKKEDILNKAKNITDVCKQYYEIKDKIPTEKQQLTSFHSVQDFIDYIQNGPESTLVSGLKKNITIDPSTRTPVKDSFKLIASTFDYDILEPLSHRAAFAISGGYRTNDGMHWCTGWEPEESKENDSYWKSYTNNGGRIFCFMHKTRYRGTDNRSINWQVQIRDDEVLEFLNGHNEVAYPGDDKTEQFKNFLIAHVDIFNAIQTKEPFNNIQIIKKLEFVLKYSNEPFIVDSVKQLATLEANDNLPNICQEIVFNIPKIPAGICASFLRLKSITFKEGVKEIGAQAFMGCPSIGTLIFPESLEIIGKEAFQNCEELKGSIRIPDNVKEIRTRAFAEDKCRLKINKGRTSKIKFDIADKDWVVRHVQSITVNQ